MAMIEVSESILAKAQELHLQDKFDEAEVLYCQLLEQNPDNIGLLAMLGSLYTQKQQLGLGIHFLEASIKGGMKEPDVFTNLALAYKAANLLTKSRENFELSIKDNPTAMALTNYSAMFIECGESKKCAELCERAIAMDPNIPVAHWNLGLSLLGDGVFERAWDEHEWGLSAPNLREDRNIANVPWWDGTPGKTVLVYGEQGMGDEIMFASMLPDLVKTNKVILECHGRLETLFKNSFDFPVYGTREFRGVPEWVKDHKIDYRLAIGSLGKFFRRSRDSFPGTPYLEADPLPKTKFRVGISWTGGGIKVGRVRKRSIPLSWWRPIFKVPDIEFVSLQYGDNGEELDLAEALGHDIKRMSEVKALDYYETAKLVKSCDLVISCCTTLIHLAGALGVPCWVMTPKYPAWRYQNEGGMPWYRSVRLYRSPTVEQIGWKPVIQRIADDLSQLTSKLKLVA